MMKSDIVTRNVIEEHIFDSSVMIFFNTVTNEKIVIIGLPNNGLRYYRTPNIDFAKTTFETFALCYT
jgi:hypothetical protein